MAVLEAVLSYRPVGLGEDMPAIHLGKTCDPSLLRTLRDRLLEEAVAEVRWIPASWRSGRLRWSVWPGC